MKIFTFSFKSLLLAAGLLLGSANAWGQYSLTDNGDGTYTETYDFANATASSVNMDWGETASVNGTTCYILSVSDIAMNDRFAGQKGSGGSTTQYMLHKTNQGLMNPIANGSRVFGILNLSAGDKITFNFTDTDVMKFNSVSNVYKTTSGDLNTTDYIESGQAYTMESAGNLAMTFYRNKHIKSITILTTTPVLDAPKVSLYNMVESDGYYNPKFTFTTSINNGGTSIGGATFYDGSSNDITSGYTFTSAGTLMVYASKSGYTKSAKTTCNISATQVGMILAYSVEDGDLVGTVNYGTGDVLADNTNIGSATWVIPGLEFSGTNITYRTWGILTTSGNRSVICNVLNENRVATYEHYDYVSNTTGYDYLTSTNNSATLKRKDKDNYDKLYAYALYVSPSEVVNVTIGTTGYSTFSSPVPLDFSGVPGLTAFVASAVGDGAVTLSSVSSAPANTGLVLKGTPSTEYNIPVTNSAVTPASNQLVGCIVNTTVAVDATSKFNNYVLVSEGGTPKFQSLAANGASIPAGKAFLKNGAYSEGAKSLRVIVDGQASEVVAPEVTETEEPEVLYNMAGLRVGKDYKGIVINQKGVKRFNR